MAATEPEIGRFLTRFRQLQQAGHVPPRTSPPEFLRRARAISTSIAEYRQQTAERFNVFEALGCQWSELAHSRFLAYLLDPGAAHDQGDLFLRPFLARLRLSGLIAAEEAQGAVVQTEFVISDGRIDIVLFLRDRGIVCIENKIDAAEQAGQIARYQGWVAAAFGHAAKCVVFLTRDGRTARTSDGGRTTVPVYCLSYRSIARWLDDLVPCVPKPLAAVLQMYVRICDQIAATSPVDLPEPIKEPT